MKIITGVHNSRRLGRSLGVNLFKTKNCNLDCIYCEYGSKSLYGEAVPFEYNEVIKAIDDAMVLYHSFDYLSFSGLGEPTLHYDFARIIGYIKTNYLVKVCVITNTTTINKKSIQNALLKVDVIIPSIDAVSKDVFYQINRPHHTLRLNEILSGFKAFSQKYSGDILLEIFFTLGINDSPLELRHFVNYLKGVKYTRLDINSLDRAPSIDHLEKMPLQQLMCIKAFFEQNGLKKINIV